MLLQVSFNLKEKISIRAGDISWSGVVSNNLDILHRVCSPMGFRSGIWISLVGRICSSPLRPVTVHCISSETCFIGRFGPLLMFRSTQPDPLAPSCSLSVPAQLYVRAGGLLCCRRKRSSIQCLSPLLRSLSNRLNHWKSAYLLLWTDYVSGRRLLWLPHSSWDSSEWDS